MSSKMNSIAALQILLGKLELKMTILEPLNTIPDKYYSIPNCNHIEAQAKAFIERRNL